MMSIKLLACLLLTISFTSAAMWRERSSGEKNCEKGCLECDIIHPGKYI